MNFIVFILIKITMRYFYILFNDAAQPSSIIQPISTHHSQDVIIKRNAHQSEQNYQTKLLPCYLKGL